MAWTTDDLVTAVRRSGWLPSAGDVATSDLLAWGDEDLNETWLEILKTAREEYLVTYEDIDLDVGVTRYRIPRRATLRTIRGVTHIDTSGDESPAEEIPALETWRYSGNRYGTASALYRFEGDEIVLAVAPTSSGTSLRVRYTTRPPRLVATTSASPIIAATDTTTLKLDVTSTPPATLTTAAALIDIVRGDSPFPTMYEDLQVKSYSSPNITLEGTTPVTVADISGSGSPGVRVDYACPRDCTVYPPLPQEMHGALAWGIVARCLESQGDARHIAAFARQKRAIDALRNAAEPRNQDRKPRIVDQGGRMRAGRFRWAWRQ